ncbi:MAG TPA: type IV pilus twitching motility protein PilT [Vicinamibacteria bacterium]|nr:type IV pilus twitching motility protein PilT [Vicinamibacteria bacterium]
MSQIASLMDALVNYDAYEARLEAGRRVYLVRGNERVDIGREPLQSTVIEKIAEEALGSERMHAEPGQPASVYIQRNGSRFQVDFRKTDKTAAMRIRRSRVSVPSTQSAAASTEPPAATPSPSRAEPAPAPRAPATSPSRAPHAIDDILRLMVSQDASDLHLSAGTFPVLRIHGEIRFLPDRGVLSSEAIHRLVHEIMPKDNREQFEARRDTDLAYEIAGLSRFRVNVFEDRNGVGAVLRRIPVEIQTAEELALPRAVLELCYLSKGLVLVTGPSGSGKSTTLAAIIDHINKNRTDHIITIEDPIEFVHRNQKCLVNQREVGRNTESFKTALRAALREDPDIVLVGEMRDLETIAIAIETAETGHLVFGTLHTTTAMSTVDRIVDQFPPDRQEQIRVMLSDALKGVIAQVLCKKIGGGRVAALEVLLANQAVASLIREAKTFQIPSVMQTSKRLGMQTMNDSLFQLVKEKRVQPNEAWLKATDKSGLLNQFRGANIPIDFAES